MTRLQGFPPAALDHAETLFRRHVMPTLHDRALACRRLPSTSPAHASRTVVQKACAWREILR